MNGEGLPGSGSSDRLKPGLPWQGLALYTDKFAGDRREAVSRAMFLPTRVRDFGSGPRVRGRQSRVCKSSKAALQGCAGWAPSVPRSPLWACVFWDRVRQLLELPADWAKSSASPPVLPAPLPPQPPSAAFIDPASCSVKAPSLWLGPHACCGLGAGLQLNSGGRGRGGGSCWFWSPALLLVARPLSLSGPHRFRVGSQELA